MEQHTSVCVLSNKDFTDFRNSSANYTKKSSSDDFVRKLCLPITILLILAEIWMTASFITFQFGDQPSSKRKKQQSKSAKIVTSSTILFLLFIFPRLVLKLALAFAGYEASSEIDYVCEVVMDMSIAAYGIAFIPIYIFPWLRQRILYSQYILPEVKKLVKCFSWSLIVFLGARDTMTVVLYLLPFYYAPSKYGCVNTRRDTYNWPQYVAAGLQAFGHIILMLLFVYPLRVHKKFQVTFFQGSHRRFCVGSGPGFQEFWVQ